jgi:hypothetical protein
MKKLFKINFVKFMQGLTLFIIALILTFIFTAISFVVNPIYHLINFKWQTGINRMGEWLKNLAISIDQFGNVSSATILNFTLRKKGGIDFGEIDDTISYVLGRNYYHKSLTIIGKIIVFILHLIERDHVKKAVMLKVEDDQEALIRIQEGKYYQ